jgi:3-oxoacyl-[acyl-carrier protein] reductase
MKTVLVTGATKGIGKAIAELYKHNGYRVIGTGTKDGSFLHLDEYFVCDFNNIAELDNLLYSIPHVDILINNAGINIISNFCDIQYDDLLKTHNVNLFAPFKLCQYFIPYMLNAGWGRIVNICSIWGKISKIGRASYSSSKFALEGMSLAMSHEFSPNNILINCVSPGFVDTELTRVNLGDNLQSIIDTVPMKRLCSPAEIANLVYWLGSENNTFTTGQNIAIDGGFTGA